MKKNTIKPLFFIFIDILILLISSFGFRQVNAQDSGWSNPLNLSNTPTNSLLPSLAVDAYGNVHIIWIEEVDPGFSVVLYSRLGNNGWSTPVDIFASNDQGMIDRAILLGDASGKLHILFSRSGIQYSWAYADQAGSALNWLPPETVVQPFTNITHHHAVISSDGGLHLVYDIANGPNSGIYYLSSPDGGITWNESTVIHPNPSPNLMVSQPRIAISKSGGIHVVWETNNYPEAFPPTGIQYSSSTDGKIWEPATPLAVGPYTEPTILALGENEVHIVWSGTDTDRYKFHRYSKNNGNSWTDTWRNTELGGLQGLPDLVADSLGRIYWLKVGTIFGMPVSSGQIQDSLHENVFVNGTWEPGQVLLPSSYAYQNQMNVTAVVAKGNELHTAVMNPLGIEGNDYQFDIYYLRKKLDSPEITISPVATITPTSQPTQTTTAEQTIEQETVLSASSHSPRGLRLSSMEIIFFSVVPAIFLVIVVVAVKLMRKSR